MPLFRSGGMTMDDYYDLGVYKRTVTTSSPQTQIWFDRGLNWLYGFNHAEAIKCFEKALETDPGCAMAHWGISYAAGPNYNLPWHRYDPAGKKRALEASYDAMQRALAAAPNASPAPGEEIVKEVSDGPARLVVVGSSSFASDDYVRFGQRLPIYTSNIVFFMGIVDFVARDDGLAPLRSKGMTARPLTIKSDATPTLVKLSNVVGVPLLFIGFGLLRWRIRLARRKRARL